MDNIIGSSLLGSRAFLYGNSSSCINFSVLGYLVGLSLFSSIYSPCLVISTLYPKFAPLAQPASLDYSTLLAGILSASQNSNVFFTKSWFPPASWSCFPSVLSSSEDTLSHSAVAQVQTHAAVTFDFVPLLLHICCASKTCLSRL